MAAKSSIARRLRKLRGGMTQEEFGLKYFGVPLRTYHRWESRADKDPPKPVLKLLAMYEKHGLD